MIKARSYETKTRAKCDRCKGTGVCKKQSTHGEPLTYFCSCRVGEKKAREEPMRIEPYPCNLTCVVRHEEDGA